MSFKKATGGGSQAPRKPPSQGRIRASIRRTDDNPPGMGGPSTLPPPPFDSETAMEGLGWWLDAHMNLASRLLWIEQQVDGEGPPSSSNVQREGHLGPIRGMLTDFGDVRDALYELYCDAADERLAPLVQPGASLDVLVRNTYVWCTLVVALLARVTTDVRTPEGPDWNLAKTEFRAAEIKYPERSHDAREAVAGLRIDFKSPVEPLRHLPDDLESLVRNSEKLRASLAARFG
jgi:hypothetical protein